MAIERAYAGASNAMAFRLLNSGLSVPELRAASPLPDNAQRIVDQTVAEVGLERLVVAGDIIAAGLTFPLTDPLSVMEVAWESVSKTGGAQRTMNPSARGENQLPDRKMATIPVYLTTDDFSMGIRTLKMSERVGTPLDTTLVGQATRRVNEAIEDATINGAGITIGTGKTPGLLNAPNANQYALTVDWTAPNVVGTTGPKMVDDVLNMVGVAQADKHYGPYQVYLGTKAGLTVSGDYKANTSGTTLSRILEIPGISGVKVADQMPSGPTGPQVVLIQMTSDVVDMITGQAPTVIPWTSNDGFTLFWLVLAIMIPRFRADYDGNSGIVIGSK
jgi:hypothetical protein